MTDIISQEKRSWLMSRIRGKDTKPERQLAALLKSENIRFVKHKKELPGKPDFVLRAERVAIFVDGDFWHGWQFPRWKDKLPLFWQNKIESNRKRDQKNFAKLRNTGWKVLRVWEHQLEYQQEYLMNMINKAIEERRGLAKIGVKIERKN